MPEDTKMVRVYPEDHYDLTMIKAELTKKRGENVTYQEAFHEVMKYFTRDKCN